MTFVEPEDVTSDDAASGPVDVQGPLSAHLELPVFVSSNLVGEEETQLPWTLQTNSSNSELRQETTLVIPSLDDLAGQLGLSAKPDAEEQGDSTPDEADPNSSQVAEDPIVIELDSAVAAPEVFQDMVAQRADAEKPGDNGNRIPVASEGGLTLTTNWFDNNSSSRPQTGDLSGGYDLYFTIDGVEHELTDQNAQKYLGLFIVEAPPQVLVQRTATNEYAASVSGLVTKVTEIGYAQAQDDEGNPLYDPETGEPVWVRQDVSHEVTWRLDDSNAYAGYFQSGATSVSTTTSEPVASSEQNLQLLTEQQFTIVGKIGEESFADFGSTTGLLYITPVVNNVALDRISIGDVMGGVVNPQLGGSLEWEATEGQNAGTLLGMLPRYTTSGEPIEYRLEYDGGVIDPGYSDYYAASYDNSASANHGSDVSYCYGGGTMVITHMGTTSFDATKQWLDNGSETRPDEAITFSLWRYSHDGSAATASQVTDSEGDFVYITFNPSETKGDSIDLGALLKEQHPDLELSKYDTDGYPFVYGVREESVPEGYETVLGSVGEDGSVTSQVPNYYNVDRSQTLPFGSQDIDDNFSRPETDRLTYNNGVVSNRLKERIPVEQVKTWNVDAFADQLKDVTCEFTLERRPAGVEGASWEEVRTQELDGFTAEHLTQTIGSTEERYDPQGREYEYRWVESGVEQEGHEGASEFTRGDDGTATFYLWLEATEDDGTAEEKIQFTSKTDPETGAIVNSFENTTYENVEKLWQQPELDENGDPVFDRLQPDPERESSVTVNLYQGETRVGSYLLDGEVDDAPTEIVNEGLGIAGAQAQETSPYYLEITGLPLYTETGGRYVYRVVEQPVAGWHSTREYDSEQHLTTIRNSYGPGESTEFHLVKDWVDGDDSAHRIPVTVTVSAARDLTTQDGETTYEKGHVFTTVTLSEDNVWFYEVSIPVGGLTVDDVVLEETVLTDIDGAEFGVMDYETAVEWAGSEAPEGYDDSWINKAWEAVPQTERVATDDHVYEVTYDSEQDGPFGKPLLSVSNRRLGSVDLSIEKTWYDEGGSKEERPAANFEITVDDPGASFSVVEGQVHLTLSGGNTVPLFANEDSTEPLTDATTADDGKTLVIPVVNKADSGDVDTANVYGLPKYDGAGMVVHYDVVETWEGDHGDYVSSVSEGAYEIGNRHFRDNQEFEVTNRRQGITDVTFYKEWHDVYVYESGSRPDIYLTLYRRGSDGVLQEVEGYVHFLWAPNNAGGSAGSGSSSNLAAKYGQLCMITDLPKYDKQGYEYEYFASENMANDGTSLGYAPVEFAENDVVVDKNTGEEAPEGASGNGYAVEDGGTFINSLTGALKIRGEKLWTNIPGTYDLDELELPKIDVFIQRRYYGEKTWPELYVTYDEQTNSLAVNDERSPEGAIAMIDGLTSDEADPQRFIFEADVDFDGNPITRYDEDGRLYEYRAIEVIVGLIGTDASMSVEEIERTNFGANEHVATGGGQVYEIRHGETGSFFISNGFNPTEGNLTVKKYVTGSQRVEGDDYPNITYTLYRRYDKGNGDMSEPERVSTAVVTGKAIEEGETEGNLVFNEDGSFSYTFTGLDIWAPNGSDYEYYVVESAIDGYTTTVGLGDLSSEAVTGEPVTAPEGTDAEGACSPAAVDANGGTVVKEDDTTPDITYANDYGSEKLELTGKKLWKDYEDAFNVRPTSDDIILSVVRTSDSGQRETLVEDEDYSLAWTSEGDEWSYTLSGLEQWAPDGSAWNYLVTESLTDEAPKVYRILDGTAKGEGTEEDSEESWTGSLDSLQNGLKGSAEVEKKWYGVDADGNPVQNADDEWGLRPTSVEVELQARYRKGENDTWTDWSNADDAFKDALSGDFSLEGFAAAQNLDEKGGWDYQWTTIPVFAKRSATDATLYEFQYRVIETKVGSTEVTIAGPEDLSITYNDAASYKGTSETTLGSGDNGMQSSTLIKNQLKATDLKVTKVWEDDDNIWGLRDETLDQHRNPLWTVTYQLQVSSDKGSSWKNVENAKGQISHDITGSLNDGDATFNTNAYTFRNLPAYDDAGNKLIYRAVEVVPGGYDVTGALGENVGEGNAVVGFDEDEERAQTYTNALFTTELEGTKAWDDHGTGLKPSLPADGSAPSVKMTLERSNDNGVTWERATYDDGTLMQPTWSDADNDGVWEWKYADLPEKDGEGNTYKYRASEDAGSVPGFYPTVDENDGTKITNVATRFTLDKVSDSTDKAEVNDVELSVMSTNKQTVYAVWKRDASGNETSFVWQNGKAASEVWTGGNIKSGSADTSDAVEMTGANAGCIVGLKAGTYKIVETGELPEGYARAADTNLTIGKDGAVNSTKPGENAVEITVTDQVFDGYFTFTKALGTADGKKLEGVTFDLYRVNDDGSEVLLAKGLTTNENGVFDSSKATDVKFEDGVDLGVGGDERKSLADGLQAGTYYLREATTTDDAYYPSGDELEFPFTIDQETNHGVANKVTVKDNAASNPGNTLLNTPFQVTVSLPKYDADTENKAAINDAEFKLQYHNGKDWVDVATGLKTGKSYTLTLDDGNGYKATGADKPASGTVGVLQLTLNMKGEYRLVEMANQGYEVPENDSEKFVVTFELENVDHDIESVYNLADASVQTDGTAKGQLGAAAENFTLDTNGVPNERLTGEATLTKTDDKNNALEGVIFSLQMKGADGMWPEVKTDLATDGNGKITVDGLEWGTYRFVETGVKDGYVGHVGDEPVTSDEFTISRTTVESAQQVTAKNAPTQLKIKKVAQDGTVLEGPATFTISGKLAGGETSVDVTTANGVAVLDDALLIAGETYTLTEKTAPAGYELAGSVEFTVDKNGDVVNLGNATGGSGSYVAGEDGGINLITATDAKIDVTFQKDGDATLDGVTNPYAGAEFTITPAEGDTFADGKDASLTKTTDANGSFELTGLLVAGSTYTVTETKAPAGYELIDGNLVFEVNADGTFKVTNQPTGYDVSAEDGLVTIKATDPAIKVTLAKVDEDGRALPGAVFTVAPKAGTSTTFANGSADPIQVTVDESTGKVSLDDALLVAGGTYTLTETVAPNGHEVAGWVDFTVGTDGTVTLVDPDETTAGVAEGTDGTGKYVAAEDANGTVTITATDLQTEVTFLKVSTKDGTALPGAEFTLTPEQGKGFASTSVDLNGDGQNDIQNGVLHVASDGQGQVVLVGLLNVDTDYTLTETKAPAGYELADEGARSFTFHVVKDGSISAVSAEAQPGAEGFRVTSDASGIELTIADEPIEARILKQDMDGTSLKGASFTLSGALANGQTTVTVRDADDGAEDGIIEIASALLVAGEDYAIEEIVAPDGHEVAGTATLHVNDDGSLVVKTASDGSGSYETSEQDGTAVITVRDEATGIELAKVGTDGATGLDATFVLKPVTGSHFTDQSLDADGIELTPATAAEKTEGMLLAGDTYTLTEKTPADGYQLLDGGFSFTVAADGTITAASSEAAEGSAGYRVTTTGNAVQVTAADAPIVAQVLKKGMNDAVEAGAVFTIKPAAGSAFAKSDGLNADGSLTLASTGEDGVAAIPSALLIAGNSYVITEVTAPAGYELAGEVTFTVSADGKGVSLDGAATGGSGSYETSATDALLTITAKDEPVEIELSKKGEKDGAVVSLKGAEFLVRPAMADDTFADAVHNADGISVTSEDASALTGQLVAGNAYTITETVAPAGYEKIVGSLTFEVDAAGNLSVVTTAENDPAFQLTDGEILITATDQPIEVTLDKRDLGDTALDGAVFSITGTFANEDGTVGAEEARTLTLEGNAIAIDGLIASREGAEYEYTLSETTAPAGYELVPDFTFKVDEAGNVIAVSDVRDDATQPGHEVAGDTITTHDEPIQIELVKQAEDGAALEGAEFTLFGDFADGTTEKDVFPGTTIDGLVAGEAYVLTETVAPAGYEKLDSIELVVAADGTVSGAAEGYAVAEDGVTVVATDIAIEARIAKVGENGEPLAGATFTIANADDPTDARTVTTGEDGTIALDDAWLVAGCTYTIVEATAPAGYELAGEASFTVAEDGTVSLVADDGSAAAVVAGREGSGSYEATVDGRVAVITAADAAIAVQLVKVSGDTPLAGAEFELTPSEGSAFADGTTDPVTLAVNANGLTAVPGLVAGNTYELREAVAPAGYELNESTLVFAVAEDGTVTTIGEDAAGYTLVDRGGTPTIVADDAPIEATLVKTDLSGNALTGAEFTLRGEFANADGTRSGMVETRTVKVDEDGSVDLSGLIAGESYELAETVAPEGYELLGASVTLLVCEDGTLELAEGTSAELRDMVLVDEASGVATVTVRNEPEPEPASEPEPTPGSEGLSKTGDTAAPLASAVLAAGGAALMGLALVLDGRRRRRN